MTGIIIAQCQDCEVDIYHKEEDTSPITCACGWVDELAQAKMAIEIVNQFLLSINNEEKNRCARRGKEFDSVHNSEY